MGKSKRISKSRAFAEWTAEKGNLPTVPVEANIFAEETGSPQPDLGRKLVRALKRRAYRHKKI
jgi:hypothetical protein